MYADRHFPCMCLISDELRGYALGKLFTVHIFYQNFCSCINPKVIKTPKHRKGSDPTKVSLSVSSFELLRFLSLIGGNANDIGKSDMQQKVNAVIQKEGLEGTAKRLNTTVHTLQLIIDGLTQPEGFDIRTGKPLFEGCNLSLIVLHTSIKPARFLLLKSVVHFHGCVSPFLFSGKVKAIS